MRTYLEKTSARPLWRAEDVGQILDVSPKTVHKLVREGKLACVQITARERRFTEEQVRQFVEQQSQPLRVDKISSQTVSYPSKKGGDRVKSVGVNGKDLREEMRRWR